MLISLLFVSALALTSCHAVDVNSVVEGLKSCSKDLGIKEDVVNKLESMFRSKLQGGDQEPAKLQEDIKAHANQVLNQSGVGNKVTDLSDCIADKLNNKDK